MGKFSRALTKAGEDAKLTSGQKDIKEAGAEGRQEVSTADLPPEEENQFVEREAEKSVTPEPLDEGDNQEMSTPVVAAEKKTQPVKKKVKKPVKTGTWDERFLLSMTAAGPLAESIRTLRTKILYPEKGGRLRTILVTSASPGEGKSFICANLAMALAQGIDSYCILLDCDLRRPFLDKLFGFANEQGIVNHLQQNISLEDLIIPSGVDKLSILPAGPPPVNPAELSGSASMVKLLNELRSRYEDRFVIMDSPPLYAAPETAVLAQHVDGVVLIIRHGLSRREHIKALAETIGKDKIIGVVYNAYKVNLLDKKVFGYYDYKSDYYYSDNK